MVDKIDIMKHYRELTHDMSQILNGVILRDKTISKAGPNSAVIFVPKYLLGQRVKVFIIPENTEVAGLRKTIDKKAKSIQKLREALKQENSTLKKDSAALDAIEAGEPENNKPDVTSKDKSLEDDDAY